MKQEETFREALEKRAKFWDMPGRKVVFVDDAVRLHEERTRALEQELDCGIAGDVTREPAIEDACGKCRKCLAQWKEFWCQEAGDMTRFAQESMDRRDKAEREAADLRTALGAWRRENADLREKLAAMQSEFARVTGVEEDDSWVFDVPGDDKTCVMEFRLRWLRIKSKHAVLDAENVLLRRETQEQRRCLWSGSRSRA